MQSFADVRSRYLDDCIERSRKGYGVAQKEAALEGRVVGWLGCVRVGLEVLVDRSEALVDRLLPPDEERQADPSALLPRALSIPRAISSRMIHIALSRLNNSRWMQCDRASLAHRDQSPVVRFRDRFGNHCAVLLTQILAKVSGLKQTSSIAGTQLAVEVSTNQETEEEEEEHLSAVIAPEIGHVFNEEEQQVVSSAEPKVSEAVILRDETTVQHISPEQEQKTANKVCEKEVVVGMAPLQIKLEVASLEATEEEAECPVALAPRPPLQPSKQVNLLQIPQLLFAPRAEDSQNSGLNSPCSSIGGRSRNSRSRHDHLCENDLGR